MRDQQKTDCVLSVKKRGLMECPSESSTSPTKIFRGSIQGKQKDIRYQRRPPRRCNGTMRRCAGAKRITFKAKMALRRPRGADHKP